MPNVFGRPALLATAFAAVVVLTVLLLFSPRNADFFDPIGRWESSEGFEVTLKSNGSYEFCDRTECASGRFIRSGGPSASGIVLVNFFRLNNSGRMKNVLRAIHSLDNGANPVDLDFTVNSGVSGAADSPNCDGNPCILFGDVEGAGPFLAFTKEH